MHLISFTFSLEFLIKDFPSDFEYFSVTNSQTISVLPEAATGHLHSMHKSKLY